MDYHYPLSRPNPDPDEERKEKDKLRKENEEARTEDARRMRIRKQTKKPAPRTIPYGKLKRKKGKKSIIQITPEEFAELSRAVSSETPSGQYFQNWMEELIRKIFPKIDLQRKPIQFIIIDESESNAFFTPILKFPIIGFSKGLLLKARYVEDLAGILGHEFTHQKFSDSYGREHRNTKLEELAADVWPLVLLTEAGLDPRQYVEFIRGNFLESNKNADIFQLIVDAHPEIHNRLRALEDGLAVVDKKYGGLEDRSPLPLTDEFKTMVTQGIHLSYIDLRLKVINYQSLSAPQQLLAFKQIVEDTPKWNQRRLRDTIKYLKQIKIKRSQLEDRQAQDALGDQLLQALVNCNSDELETVDSRGLANSYKQIFQTVAHLNAEKPQAIGRLKLLEDQIYQFMEAESLPKALEAAEILLKSLSKEVLPLIILRHLVAWPKFRLPSKSKAKKRIVPWNNLIEFAKEDRSEIISKVLLSLGVIDQRLFETGSVALETTYQNKEFPIFLGPLKIREGLDELEVDDDGHLIYEKRKKRTLSVSEKIIHEQDLESQLKQLEHDFANIDPNDETAVKEIMAVKDRIVGERGMKKPGQFVEETAMEVIGSLGSEAPPEISKYLFRWIGINSAEKNFILFLKLNEDIWPYLSPLSTSDRDTSSLMRSLVNKFKQMALSGNPQLISYLRALYLGNVKKDSPLYDFIFERNYISGFLMPIYKIVSDEKEEELEVTSIVYFIVENPGKIFSHEEQLLLLETLIDEESSKNMFDHYKIDRRRIERLRRLFDYHRPTNSKSYLDVLERFYDKGKLLAALMFIELRILIARGQLRELDFDRFTKVMGPLRIESYHKLKKYFRPLVKAKSWPEDTEQLVNQWIKIYRADLFPSDQILCYRLLKRILNKIKSLDKPQEQIKLLEILFFGHRIKDPKIRSGIENFWIRSQLAAYGKDDGSKRYTAEIQKVLDRMRAGLTLNDRILVAAKLADKLETQERLTRQFQNMAQALTKDELEGSFFKGILIEFAIRQLKETSEGRQGLIEFLISPLTSESVEKLHRLLEAEASDHLFIKDTGYRIPRRRVQAEIRYLWENFWAAPFGIRTVLFEQLLFPNESLAITGPIFEYVNDQLFPSNEEYSKEARDFVSAYFSVVPGYQHRILLSAMMVTAEKTQEEKLSLGQRLALVLEMLGPAETKLGQVIHSHPQTPLSIKSGMAHLKSRADPPFRWDLLDNYRKNVPHAVRSKVIRIGKLLGSASFYLALEAQLNDNTSGVFKILRPHALKRAENGFKIMLRMLPILASSLGSNVIEILSQMIQQAQKNAKLETNFEISSQQTTIAVRLYDQKQIILEEAKFFLHVPKIISYGETYQYIQKAPGKHFNDLPDRTPSELRYKQQLALAYFGFEMRLIFKGDQFDSDRHGAQCRIKDHNIYLFDWGGMSLESPKREELHQFGDLIFDVIYAVREGGGMEDSLSTAIQSRTNHGENVDYLLSIQRALLSLEDFRQYIADADLLRLFGTLIQGNINQEILNGFLNKALGMGLDLESLRQTLDSYGGIKIEFKRRK